VAAFTKLLLANQAFYRRAYFRIFFIIFLDIN